MASLVVAALVALASHRHQWNLAKHKQQANGIADRLLTQWFEVRGSIPARGQGVLDEQSTWAWQTQVIRAEVVCGMPVEVIRLDVLGRLGTERTPAVLSSIELMQAPSASGG
jgi:hypothetical protein